MVDFRVKKYNTAVPRYTSYPTVPCWDIERWTERLWLDAVRESAKDSDFGISLYIHLPFCESLCTYCGCNTRITKNHAVELPYLDAVLKEWKLYREQIEGPVYINDLHLGGGTPTFFEPSNLAYLIKGLLKDAQPTRNASFSFEAHPANTTHEHLQVLYDLGFRRLSLGIQDFNSEVQRIINRKQSPEDVLGVLCDARALGYESINFDLIYGLPLQTLEGMKETLDIALDMSPDRIAFYSYAHVPWMKPGQRLFTEADLPQEAAKLALYELGKSMISARGYKDIGMDHFAFSSDNLAIAAEHGSLHRNFMGYTDIKSPLLLGLGVSSISDAQLAFAQNVKKVEDYKALLDKGQLPLLKGHILTAEDLLIRKQILAIMCRRSLQFDAGSLPQDIITRLEPLIDDGLVLLNDEELLVTDAGKSFLRNICKAFDRRLAVLETEKELFSKAI